MYEGIILEFTIIECDLICSNMDDVIRAFLQVPLVQLKR